MRQYIVTIYFTWCAIHNLSIDTTLIAIRSTVSLTYSNTSLISYNTTHCHDIAWQQWERSNTDQTLNTQTTSHTHCRTIKSLLCVFLTNHRIIPVVWYMSDWNTLTIYWGMLLHVACQLLHRVIYSNACDFQMRSVSGIFFQRLIQYIPRNLHTVLLCFALLWLCNHSWWIRMMHLPIFTRVALLALGQSLDCHSASEVSLMDMGKSVST